ncbi:calmegin [Osmerus eperlanus]|uniref:calmegin n=1 Tax=Osmerus eperlanus TaxID=29151 RepID=UPI002E145844
MLMLACLLVACVFHQSSWCSTEAQSSYISPPVPERAHFAESFDSGPLDRRWVRSQTVREEDTVSLLYDGEWAIEEREAEMHPGNKALVMKSSGRHHAVAAYLHTPFHFRNSPLCLQYEVMFMEGVECSGAYIKLLSLSDQLRLSQFSDVTPYSVMFGPDMCGGNHKMHLIVTVTDPHTGQRQQRHAPQPDGDLKGYFTDRKSHLYTLRLFPDGKYEILIDLSLISEGILQTDMDHSSEFPQSQSIPNIKPPSQSEGLGLGSVEALGLELWSLRGQVMFDNILLCNDLELAQQWTQDTWEKRYMPSLLERLLLATAARPWLWGVYVFTVGLPTILFISFMWPDKRFGPPDQDYYYKKSDELQPDDPQDSELPRSPQEYGSVRGAVARKRDSQRAQKKSDLELKAR